MATAKQKKAMEIMAKNGGIASRAMLEAGYSPMTAAKPKKLTQSKAFKEVLAESGLTESLIATSLVEDIKAKPRKRVEELRLGAKILHMTGEDGGTQAVVQINIGEDREKYA